MEQIGKVTHWFGHISVAVVELSAAVKVGDTIHVKGATSDFTQPIDSMQVEHEQVEAAKKGESIGLKMKEHAHVNDGVFKG